MSKKKLTSLSFESIMKVSLVLMDNWLDTLDDKDEPSLDREFLSTLKDLKFLNEREKEHRGVVCSRLRGEIAPKAAADIENNFKVSEECCEEGFKEAESKEAQSLQCYVYI